MKEKRKKDLTAGAGLLIAFVLWTVLVLRVDVRPAGVNGTEIGFASLNVWFHRLTGVHMRIYTVTDWLGLVPILICLCFGAIGLAQAVKRRSLLRVDADIVLLGFYYILVIIGYLFFEAVPVNYRPVLINGGMEASYPSSTALLVLSVMPTLGFQAGRRVKKPVVRRSLRIFAGAFSAFMVAGRLISGVHWATDIIGSVLLGTGLFMIYRFFTAAADKRSTHRGGNENGIS